MHYPLFGIAGSGGKPESEVAGKEPEGLGLNWCLWGVCSFKSLILLDEVAERTGLEPATSGVTGRRSNQLSYRSALPVRTAGR